MTAPRSASKGARYVGLLFIGDPHLASRPPGYRKESYQEEILAKLAWALDYAKRERLKPALLGDLFHWPRDNANALVVALLRMFGALDEPLAMIAGNHDMRHAPLREEDTLAILETAGAARIVDGDGGPWSGAMDGRRVLLGGTSWGQPLPTKKLPEAAQSLVDRAKSESGGDDLFAVAPLVVWMTHHDLAFPNAPKPEEAAARGPIEARPAPTLAGVEIAVNGHIHRPVDGEAGLSGETHWFNPGNIARITRSVATRERRPGLLRIDVAAASWTATRVEVPILPFEEVFHDPELADTLPDGSLDGEYAGDSSFVRGLELLKSRRTAGGQGLWDFLEQNLGDVAPEVAEEVRDLARRALAEAGAASDSGGEPVA